MKYCNYHTLDSSVVFVCVYLFVNTNPKIVFFYRSRKTHICIEWPNKEESKLVRGGRSSRLIKPAGAASTPGGWRVTWCKKIASNDTTRQLLRISHAERAIIYRVYFCTPRTCWSYSFFFEFIFLFFFFIKAREEFFSDDWDFIIRCSSLVPLALFSVWMFRSCV